MRPADKETVFWNGLFFVLISYLVINTGIASDDISFGVTLKNTCVLDLLIPKRCMHTPAESVFFFIWYPFLNVTNQLLANILKISYLSLSFYMISRFFGLYIDRKSALLASFLFLFFPSHDSTVYWFLGQYLTLSMAFYLYAYYLAHKGRPIPAFIMAMAGSFISYGSPVIAVSLFAIFAMKKEPGKGLTLLVPNLLYAAYYLTVTKVFPVGIDRIPSSVDIIAICKQMLLQIGGFLDSTIGPSMWLKIYYAFPQLSAVSAIIGVIIVVLFYRAYGKARDKFDTKILSGFILMTVLSFVMFSVTGYYPQIAFNLGNRATIFGSLLLSYIVVLLPAPNKIRAVIILALIFTILGISDHWKGWNIHQQKVISRISANSRLKGLQDGVIYVSGNQYSKYGRISHIEFLSEAWVVDAVVKGYANDKIEGRPINKRFKYEDGYLTDTKYASRQELSGSINVYDSVADRLLNVDAAKINDYISSMPEENRHWAQLSGGRCLKVAILALMPRLKYAL